MKALITSGCSVSDVRFGVSHLRTWPIWLENKLQPEYTVHSGLRCTGNDLIARKAIYQCTQALQQYNGEDILLVCAYSTLNRTSILLDSEDAVAKLLLQQGQEDRMRSLFSYQGSNYDVERVEKNQHPAWYYFNLWEEHEFSNYYALYQSSHNLLHDYLWNMFAVENFCKANRINYVWLNIDDTLTTQSTHNMLDHWSMEYLRQTLAYQHRITAPIATSVFEYDAALMLDELHPNTQGHRWYTKNILIPFLQEHEFI